MCRSPLSFLRIQTACRLARILVASFPQFDELLAEPAVVAGRKNGESPVKVRRCRATVRHSRQARMPTRELVVVTTSFA